MKKTDVVIAVLIAIFIWLFIVKRCSAEFFETPKFIAKPINWWIKKFDSTEAPNSGGQIARGLNTAAPAPTPAGSQLPSNVPAPAPAEVIVPAPSLGQPLPEVLSEVTTPSSVPAAVPAEPQIVPIPMI